VRNPSLLVSTLITILLFLPSVGSALSFQSDFSDFNDNWNLEAGTSVTHNAGSITLRASTPSERERGRILIRPILATTHAEIANLMFVVEASAVSAPFAARVFYYDDQRNYLGSDPLFGTQQAGTIVAAGTVLNPMENVGGIRVRLYSNAQEGSVTVNHLSITTVPEPGTALLMGLGLAGLSAAGRRSTSA
jgi:hypothetical protein